jgi:hypothetical protein
MPTSQELIDRADKLEEEAAALSGEHADHASNIDALRLESDGKADDMAAIAAEIERLRLNMEQISGQKSSMLARAAILRERAADMP